MKNVSIAGLILLLNRVKKPRRGTYVARRLVPSSLRKALRLDPDYIFGFYFQ